MCYYAGILNVCITTLITGYSRCVHVIFDVLSLSGLRLGGGYLVGLWLQLHTYPHYLICICQFVVAHIKLFGLKKCCAVALLTKFT